MQLSICVRSTLICTLAAATLTTATLTTGPATCAAADSLQITSSGWQTPTAEVVESALLDWLIRTSASERQAADRELSARDALNALYTNSDRLDNIIEVLSIASPDIAELTEVCERSPKDAESLEWLDSADIPYWIRANVRLYVGRALVRHTYYEQALSVFQGIGVDEVSDPATLLFYRSIAEHQLVRVEEANRSLTTLLDGDHALPERYVQLARLMQADVANVKKDSLDHIARRMSDVHRRLDLGQSGERAQKVERGILASLDKIIKQLEDQAKQQQQQQQQPGGQPASQPMEESRIAELKGDGKVDIKDIGDHAGWGDLPPRQRERVLQQIGRDFPGHYRDLMEEYLKRLATDERDQQEP